MSKPVYALYVYHREDCVPLYFEDYAVLLATRAAFVDAAAELLPELRVEEPAGQRLMFLRPASALQHVKLWSESLVGHRVDPIPGERRAASRGGHSRGDEIMALLRRPGGVSLDEGAAILGILPASVGSLISVTTRAKGHTAILDNGRYTLKR